MDYPKKLNIGSGKDFREDFLNLDIDESWSPDIIVDLNESFPKGRMQKFNTKRFGKIEVRKNSFDLIIAYDVLEHIRNLTVALKSCLDLLKEGGILDFLVPYDLSYGAWQDPFHVRTFNERSFFYYTDWFWYLGWNKYRFKLEKLKYVFSELGKQLLAGKIKTEDIARAPRAVDYLQGSLKKIALNDEDREKLKMYRRNST